MCLKILEICMQNVHFFKSERKPKLYTVQNWTQRVFSYSLKRDFKGIKSIHQIKQKFLNRIRISKLFSNFLFACVNIEICLLENKNDVT